jgi:hypothetical protein
MCLNEKTEALKIANLLKLFYESNQKIVGCSSFLYIFSVLQYSVLATPLLMSPILYFLKMSGFGPRELLWQVGALPT